MKNIKFTNGRGMSKIVKLLSLATLIGFIGLIGISGVKEYCLPWDLWNAMGGDPSGFSVLPSQADAEARMENALINHPELFDLNDPEAQAILKKHGKTGGGSTPAAPASPSAPAQPGGKADGKQTAAVKVTVYFTDSHGRVIGSSQVTAGTTIADSQFPKTVEDVDGKTFDKWDYDGKVMTNDYIVRAIFMK